MTKAGAVQKFWESFGMPAYEESSVPFDAKFPYVTYQYVSGSFGTPVSLTGSLWFKSTGWRGANAKAEEISAAIGRGGMTVDYDGGTLWIQRGKPFSQSMGDPSDGTIKRKYLNLSAEFWSAN